MTANSRPLAVVTGASTGIGYELAKCCAENGFDLIVAADEPESRRRRKLSRHWAPRSRPSRPTSPPWKASTSSMPLSAAGRWTRCSPMPDAGSGKGFLDQDFDDVMRRRQHQHHRHASTSSRRSAATCARAGEGRILITGSIAGFMPGTYQAVYNATKAFLDSFSFALRAELKDSGITVTCLMPGATETEFFERADMLDTKVGQAKKDDPADVARTGFKAMMNGEGDVVSGWQNKLQSAIANVTPAAMLAEQHRKKAEPGSGKKQWRTVE